MGRSGLTLLMLTSQLQGGAFQLLASMMCYGHRRHGQQSAFAEAKDFQADL
jgi:hypothetical protein